MPFTARAITMEDLPTKEHVDALQTELTNFLKVVKKNPQLLSALCEFGVVDAARFDSSMTRCTKDQLNGAGAIIIQKVLNGQQCNGKEGQWSCGWMGSRWCDIEAPDFSARCAFYSKRFYKGEWKREEPYFIQLTVECKK